jgi:hypothetical protein
MSNLEGRTNTGLNIKISPNPDLEIKIPKSYRIPAGGDEEADATAEEVRSDAARGRRWRQTTGDAGGSGRNDGD